jgi:hypothetical protein
LQSFPENRDFTHDRVLGNGIFANNCTPSWFAANLLEKFSFNA